MNMDVSELLKSSEHLFISGVGLVLFKRLLEIETNNDNEAGRKRI
jgi:hypothetical protein